MDNEDAILQKNSDKHLCIGTGRDESKICVTESPADIYIIENSTDYNGDYFSLAGNLSPLDGRGPSEIGIIRLEERLKKIILANLFWLLAQLLKVKQLHIIFSSLHLSIILRYQE